MNKITELNLKYYYLIFFVIIDFFCYYWRHTKTSKTYFQHKNPFLLDTTDLRSKIYLKK